MHVCAGSCDREYSYSTWCVENKPYNDDWARLASSNRRIWPPPRRKIFGRRRKSAENSARLNSAVTDFVRRLNLTQKEFGTKVHCVNFDTATRSSVWLRADINKILCRKIEKKLQPTAFQIQRLSANGLLWSLTNFIVRFWATVFNFQLQVALPLCSRYYTVSASSLVRFEFAGGRQLTGVICTYYINTNSVIMRAIRD